jgi:hypothetical protein
MICSRHRGGCFRRVRAIALGDALDPGAVMIGRGVFLVACWRACWRTVAISSLQPDERLQLPRVLTGDRTASGKPPRRVSGESGATLDEGD